MSWGCSSKGKNVWMKRVLSSSKEARVMCPSQMVSPDLFSSPEEGKTIAFTNKRSKIIENSEQINIICVVDLFCLTSKWSCDPEVWKHWLRLFWFGGQPRTASNSLLPYYCERLRKPFGEIMCSVCNFLWIWELSLPGNFPFQGYKPNIFKSEFFFLCLKV